MCRVALHIVLETARMLIRHLEHGELLKTLPLGPEQPFFYEKSIPDF